jgi:hypothetical protein
MTPCSRKLRLAQWLYRHRTCLVLVPSRRRTGMYCFRLSRPYHATGLYTVDLTVATAPGGFLPDACALRHFAWIRALSCKAIFTCDTPAGWSGTRFEPLQRLSYFTLCISASTSFGDRLHFFRRQLTFDDVKCNREDASR